MAVLEESVSQGVPVLSLSGVLDQEGVRTLEAKVEAIVRRAGGSVVIADLSGVAALGTSGISMLLAARRALGRAGGRLLLTGTRGYCDEVLRRCRLDVVFTTLPDLAAALDAAKQQP